MERSSDGQKNLAAKGSPRESREYRGGSASDPPRPVAHFQSDPSNFDDLLLPDRLVLKRRVADPSSTEAPQKRYKTELAVSAPTVSVKREVDLAANQTTAESKPLFLDFDFSEGGLINETNGRSNYTFLYDDGIGIPKEFRRDFDLRFATPSHQVDEGDNEKYLTNFLHRTVIPSPPPSPHRTQAPQLFQQSPPQPQHQQRQSSSPKLSPKYTHNFHSPNLPSNSKLYHPPHAQPQTPTQTQTQTKTQTQSHSPQSQSHQPSIQTQGTSVDSLTSSSSTGSLFANFRVLPPPVKPHNRASTDRSLESPPSSRKEGS